MILHVLFLTLCFICVAYYYCIILFLLVRTLEGCQGIPSVIEIFSSHDRFGRYNIVYEYVPGRDLRSHLDDHRRLPDRHVARMLMRKLAFILQVR